MPTVYLLVDAVLHVEVEWEEVEGDGEVVHVDAADLEGVALLQLGPDVQVVGHGFPNVRLFDFVVSFDGVEVPGRLTVSDIHRMERDVRAAQRPCPVTLRRAPLGKQNRTPPSERGWVYLERFLTMVKVAMVEDEDFGKVCFSNSQAALEQIREGGQLLREAAQRGGNHLKEVLDTFFNTLEHKQFSAASTDGTLLDGQRGAAETDRQVVAHIMEQMVAILSSQWKEQSWHQRQRQLLLAVNRRDVDGVRCLLAARASPNERGEGGQSLLHVSARFRDLALTEVLIEFKANVGCQDDHGNCPAHTLPLFAVPQTLQLFDVLSPPPVLGLQNEACVTVAGRFASWSMTAQDNEAYMPAQVRVEGLKRCAPQPFVRSARTHMFRTSQVVFGVQRGICAVRCRGQEFFVHTWESSANASVHMLYLTGCAGLPWSMQEPAVDAVVSDWCSRHSLKVFVVTHRSVHVTSKMTLEEFHEGVLCVVQQLPLKDGFVLFDNMRMLAGLSWKLQDRLLGLLIAMGSFFSDEFLMSPAWMQQRENLLRMAEMFLRRDAAKVHSSLLNVYVYGDLQSDAWEQLRHQHQAAVQDSDDQFWAFGAAFMAWPLTFSETLASCAPLRPLPAALLCGDNAPAGNTHASPLRCGQQAVVGVGRFPSEELCGPPPG